MGVLADKSFAAIHSPASVESLWLIIQHETCCILSADALLAHDALK